MTRTIQVIQVGSPVSIGIDHDMPAVVTGVSIREHDHVTYECSWWDGRQHQCKWLEDIEVVRADDQAVSIGFNP